jgi:D-citramalate synthase
MVNKPQESFSAVEKLTIAQLLLEELNVDRKSPLHVSEGEFQVKGIMA